MVRQAFGEETRAVHGCLNGMLGSGRLNKVRHVKSKVKSMLIILFDIKGVAHKEFTLAGQTVNSVYYCDCIKMCEDFTQPFGNNALSLTSFFTRESLTKNNMTIPLYPP
jgi:hypothetical protein